MGQSGFPAALELLLFGLPLRLVGLCLLLTHLYSVMSLKKHIRTMEPELWEAVGQRDLFLLIWIWGGGLGARHPETAAKARMARALGYGFGAVFFLFVFAGIVGHVALFNGITAISRILVFMWFAGFTLVWALIINARRLARCWVDAGEWSEAGPFAKGLWACSVGAWFSGPLMLVASPVCLALGLRGMLAKGGNSARRIAARMAVMNSSLVLAIGIAAVVVVLLSATGSQEETREEGGEIVGER